MSDRNCVNCVHWEWYSGHGAYSDVTPGEEWYSLCGKKHWNMSGSRVTEEIFRKNMNKANGCADYEERES